MALDKNAETFVMHVATLLALIMQVYPFHQAQLRLLLANKAPIQVPSKYSDFPNVFLFDLVIELPENIGMNEHDIELVDRKQPHYGPIYALSPVELETLNTYIKTNLKTGFI